MQYTLHWCIIVVFLMPQKDNEEEGIPLCQREPKRVNVDKSCRFQQSEIANETRKRDFGQTIAIFVISVLSTIFIVLVVVRIYATQKESRNDLLMRSSNSPHPFLSIHVEQGIGNEELIFVIDNNPLLNAPSNLFEASYAKLSIGSTLSSMLQSSSKSGSKKEILASGRWMRNVDGNGWHYLSIHSTDMDTSIDSTKKRQGDVDSNRAYFSQRYLRTMEAIGYLGKLKIHFPFMIDVSIIILIALEYFLEGYATCKEMNEWYINFYSGLISEKNN